MTTTANGTEVRNANDEVGIYMMNAGSGIEAATAQNKKYIAQTNGTLTAAPGNGIYLPESGNVDFIAYYPYTTSVSGNKLAVNVSDQSNPAAIDLIYSNGTKGVAATTATTISLGFTHQLTKVTLNVTKDETIETLNGLGVNIKGISTEGEFNLANGTLTATAGTNNKDVAMYIDAQGTTATATAIILPTAASTDQTSLNLTFNLNGQSFTHTGLKNQVEILMLISMVELNQVEKQWYWMNHSLLDREVLLLMTNNFLMEKAVLYGAMVHIMMINL